MKIAVFSYESEPVSGWGTVTKYLVDGLKKLDYDVVVLDYKSQSLVSFERFSPLSWVRDWIRVRRKIKDSHLILCLCEPLLALALFSKCLSPRKMRLVAMGHGTYIYFPFLKGIKGKINRFILSMYDLVLVPSSYTRNRVKEFYRKDTLYIWPLGIDCSKYFSLSGVKREKSIISVGDPKPRKGTEVLLKAFSKVLDSFPDAKLYIIGNGSDHYYKCSAELGIGRSVIFTGKVSHEELLSYYSRCSVHVLPSVNTPESFEGFGLVHLEANACGLPTIGSKGTANDEVIIDGYNGFLCEQSNFLEISDRIEKILSSNFLFDEMSLNSRKHALNYTWEKATFDFIEKISQGPLCL